MRAPAIGILTLALSFYTGFYLNRYRADYEAHSAAQAHYWQAEGSVYAESGRSVLFRPDGAELSYLLTPREEDFPLPLKIGGKYRITGEPYMFRPANGPGLFDRRRWAYLNGVVAGIRVDSVTPTGEGDALSRFYGLSQQFRETAAAVMMQGAPAGNAARQVVVSSVLGNKTESLPETQETFLRSGCLHVFAVSGMQVGLVAVILFMFFKLLRLDPVRANWLCLPMLALYVFVTGMSASALRALIMVSVWLLAFILRRKAHPLNVLSLAFVTLCLINPVQVYQPGFQLSFCVYAVILAASAWVIREKPLIAPDEFIPARIYHTREKALVRAEKWFRGGIIVSVGAWLASIPLTMWHFGTWNLYSPLTSLGLAFIVLPLMLCALAGLAFFWWPGALVFFNSLAGWFGGCMLSLTQLIADLPCSFLPAHEPAEKNEAMIVPLYRDAWSVIISNPGAVIDAGTDKSVDFTLTPLMRARHIEPACLMTLRQSKKEHAGAKYFLSRYPHATGSDGSAPAPHPARISFAPGNELSMLNLSGQLSTGVHQDKCPVLLWECHGQRMLLIGNAAFSGLLRAKAPIKADLLLIGHHPRDPVMGPLWIEKTGARHVIFTTPHECPVPPGVKVYRLSQTGVIYLKAEPNGLTLTPWR